MEPGKIEAPLSPITWTFTTALSAIGSFSYVIVGIVIIVLHDALMDLRDVPGMSIRASRHERVKTTSALRSAVLAWVIEGLAATSRSSGGILLAMKASHFCGTLKA